MDSWIYIYYNTSCRYKDPEKDAGMTILDIGLLTGYTPDLNQLNQVSYFSIFVFVKQWKDLWIHFMNLFVYL